MYVEAFLMDLFFTCLMETAVLFLMVRLVFKYRKTTHSNALLFFLGVLCSLTTLPYLWFVFSYFIKARVLYLSLGESAVTLAEAVMYYFFLKIGVKKSILLSLVCNGTSFLGGYVVSYCYTVFH